MHLYHYEYCGIGIEVPKNFKFQKNKYKSFIHLPVIPQIPFDYRKI